MMTGSTNTDGNDGIRKRRGIPSSFYAMKTSKKQAIITAASLSA